MDEKEYRMKLVKNNATAVHHVVGGCLRYDCANRDKKCGDCLRYSEYIKAKH